MLTHRPGSMIVAARQACPELSLCKNCVTIVRLRPARGQRTGLTPSKRMMKTFTHYCQAQFLYWSVMLVVMTVDDAALLAMMFC